jgi:hypothetical protein
MLFCIPHAPVVEFCSPNILPSLAGEAFRLTEEEHLPKLAAISRKDFPLFQVNNDLSPFAHEKMSIIFL